MIATAHPTSPVGSPHELLLGHARLTGAEQLLDPARLSALLGREVTPDRLRIKPGASVLVSYRTSDSATTALPGLDLGEVGWAQLVRSPDKRENILRRAARLGSEVREHPQALPTTPGDGPFLLSGGIDSDPRLGSEIDRVLRRQQGGTAPRLLSYNPGRHAVLLLPGSGEVLRVASRPLDDLLQVVSHWRGLGLPTLEQRRWRERRAVLVGEHWGQGDLAALASHPLSMPAATRLGGIIARLHGADVSGQDLPAARIGDPIPEALTALTDLLPHRAAQLTQLADRLGAALTADAPRVLIHGDLSPDQVLVSVDETALPGQGRLPLRVVDLDRSGLGPAGADLGSWLASCLLAGVEEQGTAFLRGYARDRALPSPEQLAAWTARALLAAALDPLRRGTEDWLPAVERRLALAGAVLERPGRLPLPTTAAGGDPTEEEQLALVPARVEHRGTRLTVRGAWADDGRGLPLELADETAGAGGAPLRAARLDPATGQVTVLEAGTDPRLPGLARVLAAHTGAVVVSHRPGKRAVVRIRDDQGAVRYVKIVRPGRAARLLEAIARAEDFTGPFRTAQVLAVDEDTVTFAELPGQLLHDGLPVADGTWRRAWRETLDAWCAAVAGSRARLAATGHGSGVAGSGAHGSAVQGSDGHAPEVHGPEAEAAVLTVWCERADAVDPAGVRARTRAVAAAHRELSRLEGVAHPSLIHRDLHDKQVLWREGEAPALLDVDTATLGDPALDAGNLRAHATWRALQEIWSEEQADVVRGEIDRAAARSEIRPEALAAYESSTLARLACVYAFRPRWRSAARTLAAGLDPAPAAGPTTGPAPVGPAPVGPASVGPAPVGPASVGLIPNSRPAPAGDPTPPGGTATPLERSMSR